MRPASRNLLPDVASIPFAVGVRFLSYDIWEMGATRLFACSGDPGGCHVSRCS